MDIPFVDSVRSVQDGATNKVASQLGSLRLAKSKADGVVGSIDSALAGMSNLQTSGFASPNIPDITDISNAMGQATSVANGVIGDIYTVTGITGSCFATAIGTLGGMVGDTQGVMTDMMRSIEGFVAPEIAQLQKLMDVHRQFLASIGVDKLIADLTKSLGCLSDSGIVGGVIDEVNTITSSMGLNSQGIPDNATYYELMKQKMTDSGLSAGYVDELSAATSNMSTQAAALAADVKASASAQMESVVSPVTKVPAPPTLW